VQGPASLEAANATGPLADLRSGAIDPAGYVEKHVGQATEHLQDFGEEMVKHVQDSLRDACESSPLLSELIARASR